MQPAFPTSTPSRASADAPAPTDAVARAWQQVGAHLVSPRIRACADGWFSGTVAIRPEADQHGTDRVLTLTRLFRCAKEATAYAHAEALQWISAAPRTLAMA